MLELFLLCSLQTTFNLDWCRKCLLRKEKTDWEYCWKGRKSWLLSFYHLFFKRLFSHDPKNHIIFFFQRNKYTEGIRLEDTVPLGIVEIAEIQSHQNNLLLFQCFIPFNVSYFFNLTFYIWTQIPLKYLQTTNEVLLQWWFFFDGVENILLKGKNDGCQHFFLFAQCF